MPSASESLARLDEITRRLRVDCPWDREQDERSIVPHTVEEAYELADAAGAGDDAKLLDELGDVLFQVFFLALLLEERGAGDLGAVAEAMNAKLVRRHPHVFGDDPDFNLGTPGREAEDVPSTASEVLANWDRIKRDVEGRSSESEPFADVPENLPALLYARKLQRRAASAGLAGEAASERMPDPAERERTERELGARLFELVDEARRARIDPELALRAAAQRFRDAHQP